MQIFLFALRYAARKPAAQGRPLFVRPNGPAEAVPKYVSRLGCEIVHYEKLVSRVVLAWWPTSNEIGFRLRTFQHSTPAVK
jgi:hypothetical protein